MVSEAVSMVTHDLSCSGLTGVPLFVVFPGPPIGAGPPLLTAALVVAAEVALVATGGEKQ